MTVTRLRAIPGFGVDVIGDAADLLRMENLRNVEAEYESTRGRSQRESRMDAIAS